MLKTIFTTKNIIFGGIVIGLIILLMQVDSCRNRDFRAQQNKIDSLTLANQKLVQDTNRLGQTISKQEVIIASGSEQEKQLKELTATLFNLKKSEEKRIKQVEALIQIASNIHVDPVTIPFVDNAKEKKFSDSVEKACADVIAFYRSHSVELTDTTSKGELAKHVAIDSTQDKFFQFNGSVLKSGFRINSINLPDSQRIAVIVAKGGLFKRDVNGKLKIFKRKTMEIQVLHTNKYINITGMSSIVYKPKVKGRWVERLLMIGAGAAGAIYLTK